MPVAVTVEAERRYLHRVIQNLVGNAVRYCDNKILISGGLDQDGQAYVCVEDDGPGIPEIDRARILKPLPDWMIAVPVRRVVMV